MKRTVLVIGAGGHAKVVIDALLAAGEKVMGILDSDSSKIGTQILGVPVLGGDDLLASRPDLSAQSVVIANGLGSIRHPMRRAEVYLALRKQGYEFCTVKHPSAVIASDVTVGSGVQIMAGAVIQSGTRVGENVIINTRVGVDHDAQIGAHVHLAPGVTLSGGVSIGALTHIGTGANIIQGVRIGEGCLIGAGALVLKDIADGAFAFGAPAQVKSRGSN